jgi:hypothetical protein
MKANIGTTDKYIRIILAVIIAVLNSAHIITGITATILLIIGAVLIITSLVNFCPLYLPFGISTRKKEK